MLGAPQSNHSQLSSSCFSRLPVETLLSWGQIPLLCYLPNEPEFQADLSTLPLLPLQASTHESPRIGFHCLKQTSEAANPPDSGPGAQNLLQASEPVPRTLKSCGRTKGVTGGHRPRPPSLTSSPPSAALSPHCSPPELGSTQWWGRWALHISGGSSHAHPSPPGLVYLRL